MSLKKIAIISALFLILNTVYFILSTATAHGQAANRTLTVTPPRVFLSADPGDTNEGRLGIINDSSETLTFNIEPEDFIVSDTLGTPNVLPPGTLKDNKYSGAAWVGMSPNSFTLEPHKRQNLSYYIQVPKDARPGGHYVAVVFKPVVKTNTEGSGATVESQIGTLLYITVNGPIHEEASVTKFFTDFFHEYGPVKIGTQITNKSDMHIAPDAIITVTNMLGGKTVSKLESHNIFPGTGRDFTNTIGKKFMFGPYSAKVTGYYGKNNNLPLLASVSFFVFPWRIAFIIILIIVAIVLGMKYMKKKDEEGKKPSQPTPPVAPQAPQTPQNVA